MGTTNLPANEDCSPYFTEYVVKLSDRRGRFIPEGRGENLKKI